LVGSHTCSECSVLSWMWSQPFYFHQSDPLLAFSCKCNNDAVPAFVVRSPPYANARHRQVLVPVWNIRALAGRCRPPVQDQVSAPITASGCQAPRKSKGYLKGCLSFLFVVWLGRMPERKLPNKTVDVPVCLKCNDLPWASALVDASVEYRFCVLCLNLKQGSTWDQGSGLSTMKEYSLDRAGMSPRTSCDMT
jgi:hypothetical protein